MSEPHLLYRRVLGPAFDTLPPAVRAMHSGVRRAVGSATVERGGGIFARFIAGIVGFPPAGQHDLTVTFRLEAGGEVWRRSFGRSSLESVQFDGRGRAEGLLCERFGALTFAIALVFDGEKLNLVTRRWSVLGVPMPLWAAPRVRAYEADEGGAFRFFVEISHAFTGLIARYTGLLRPA